MFRVGLTGGIGSGKSTVAHLFAEKGIPIIDTDAIARDLVQPGSPALDEIRRHFGGEIITPEGLLNRRRLRKRIFANPGEKRWLEKLLHPIISRQMQAEATRQSSPYVILEIPLLFEAGMEHEVDRILTVDIPESLQVDRVSQRDDTSPEQAKAIIGAQINRASRIKHSHDIIRNYGEFTNLQPQVDQLHEEYLKLSQT